MGTGKKSIDSGDAPKALKGTELFDIIDIIFEANKNSQLLSSFKVLENYYKMDPELRSSIYKLDITDTKIIKEYQDIAYKYTDQFIASHPKFLDDFFAKPISQSTSVVFEEKSSAGESPELLGEI